MVVEAAAAVLVMELSQLLQFTKLYTFLSELCAEANRTELPPPPPSKNGYQLIIIFKQMNTKEKQ